MILKVLLVGLLATSGVNCQWGIFDTIGSVSDIVTGGISNIINDVGSEIAAVVDPVGDIVASLVFSQCELVKNILGVNYDHLAFPDISTLNLIFRNKSVEVRMGLTTAAEIILSQSPNVYEENIYIILHGFIASPEADTTAELNQNLIDQGNTNVFMLDASSLIGFFYLRSTTYIRHIGETLAEVLSALHQRGVKPENIHLIGHSLGAHMSGFAGKTFTKLTGKKIGRISALDPAGPCFSNIDSDAKITKNDADFVDVTHTNAGIAGNADVLGHVDFFPNGGSLQPGCVSVVCNHGRSWEFYTESLHGRQKFPSIRCENFQDYKKGRCENNISYMGFNSKRTDAEGMYFLMTNERRNFDLGESGLAYNSHTIVAFSKDILIDLFAAVGDIIGLDLSDFVASLIQ